MTQISARPGTPAAPNPYARYAPAPYTPKTTYRAKSRDLTTPLLGAALLFILPLYWLATIAWFVRVIF
jgi:hypothetical protein